jgi:hypothetical protein
MTSQALRNQGRYFIAISGIEYVAMPISVMDDPRITHMLMPPSDTTYPNSPVLMVLKDSTIYSEEGKLAITTADLDFTGAYHDWQTQTRTKA